MRTHRLIPLLTTRILTHLRHALSASPTNFPAVIHAHTLSLLRGGEYTTFPALLERVISDVALQTASVSGSSSQQNGLGNGTGLGNRNGNSFGNGKRKADDRGADGEGDNDGEGERKRIKASAPLALPADVVAEGVRVTRGCLDIVCEIENE